MVNKKNYNLEDLMVVLISHAAFSDEKKDVHGPAHSVDEYLTFRKIPHFFLRHPINGRYNSILQKGTKISIINGKNVPIPIRPFWEVAINLKLCWHNRKEKPFFIGIDPLNAFSGWLAKLLGWVNYVVFYTPDYTEKRFNSRLINYFYHFLDSFTARRVDQIWCVSKTIVAIREQQKIFHRKIYYVPNTPSFRKIKSINSKKTSLHTLVMVGNINKTIEYSLVVESVKNMLHERPDLQLLIIGKNKHIAELENLIDKYNLGGIVKLLGSIAHAEVIKILKSCGIGIALYTGEFSTNYYGDSMKIREYLACGLPVITTDITETAKVVKDYQAGEVIRLDKKAFINAVNKIFNGRNYIMYQKNAIKAATQYNFDKMIMIPLKKW